MAFVLIYRFSKIKDGLGDLCSKAMEPSWPQLSWGWGEPRGTSGNATHWHLLGFTVEGSTYWKSISFRVLDVVPRQLCALSPRHTQNRRKHAVMGTGGGSLTSYTPSLAQVRPCPLSWRRFPGHHPDCTWRWITDPPPSPALHPLLAPMSLGCLLDSQTWLSNRCTNT